jgi:signal transduction histidine kinase
MSRRLVLALGVVSGALVAAAVLLELTVHARVHNPKALFDNLAPASTWILGGLIAWARRPDNRCGLLMAMTGWVGLAPYLYWNEPVWFTLSQPLGGLGWGFIFHLAVVFPEGRLQSRFQRVVVAAGYADAVISAVWEALFTDPARAGCLDCPHNLLLIRADPQLADARGPWLLPLDLFIIGSIITLLIRRWRCATPPGRRVLTPPLGMGVVAFLLLVVFLVAAIVFHAARGSTVFTALEIAASVAGAAVPLAFLAGLLRTRLHRGAVAGLLIELNRAPTLAQLRAAIARALGDPNLQLGFWLPEQRRYVHCDGRAMHLPSGGQDRAVTLLESDDAPLAALVYDPSLLEDPTMVDAVASAARLALENARLHVQLQAQLSEVRASRARIVAAGDAERRKIERNLHDGAQQRLLGIRLALRLARARAGDTAALEALIEEADAEVVNAVEEIRQLARGIHPAVLGEAGLVPALWELAHRSPVPVAVSAPVGRLPAAVEAAAYFVVAEALANVAKHAHAGSATVDVERQDGQVVLEVADDGVGGATMLGGSGLRNLHDRVEALGGTLSVDSAAGCGTRVRAVIPCG